jgi:hypothetical protein
MQSRRNFLKTAISATAYIALTSSFRKAFGAVLPDKKLPAWKDLVEIARWCPSVHNMQAHKLKIISEEEAELYYDPTRLLPVGDPPAIFFTVALGIFIENLSIAASSAGAKVEITEVFEPLSVNAKEITRFARLKMKFSDEKEELNPDLILQRKTSRLPYDGKPLGEDTLNKLKETGAKYGHEFFYSSEKEMVDFVIDLNQVTLFEDISSKADREELDRLFRYNKHEAETKKDGLWAKCMGFSGSLIKSIFRHHEKWEKGWYKKFLAKHYLDGFKGSATVCWFAGKFDDRYDWINAGQMFARSWLHITKGKGYIHPFGSLITNASANKKLKEKLPTPQEGNTLWMIFRAGYSDEPARSYRLSTEEIIIP